MASCSTIKSPGYLLKEISKDTVIANTSEAAGELKIAAKDILLVTLSSLSPAEDAVFNAPGEVKNGTGGYKVTEDGKVFFHKIGVLSVAGLTRRELKTKLENELQPYFRDPVITVNFANHKVTVLGASSSSKVIDMPAENISIFDALAISPGASLENIKINNIMVVRERSGSKEIKHINLEDKSIFNSPWYYLQPNDVVLLTPDYEKTEKQERRLRTQQTTSFVWQALSIVILVYQLFK